MTTVAGFLFASQGNVELDLLIYTSLGVGFVIASGCVFNNYLDREIDKKMTRTKNRALVTGKISVLNALVFATILGLSGFLILATKTNVHTVILGFIAIFSYVVVYGFAKRRSVHGTLVGSIPGSMSLVAGYVAVSGKIDEAAILLFMIMAIWQMPHFYAISIFRKSDYVRAKLPVSSVVRGVMATKKQILIYIVLFMFTSLLLSIRGFSGLTYLVVMMAVSLRWLQLALSGFAEGEDNKWARSLFGFSLVVLLVFSFMISVDSWIW